MSDEDFEIEYRDHIYLALLDADGQQLLVIYGSDPDIDFDNFQPDAEEVLASLQFDN